MTRQVLFTRMGNILSFIAKSRIYKLLVTRRGCLPLRRRVGFAIFVACLSPSMALAANGTFTASSECVGGGITFSLRNNSSHTSIQLHDRMLVVLNQSSQVVYEPNPGSMVVVAVWSNPPNKRTWQWNQNTPNGAQAPVGTYVVVLAVDDDGWDPNTYLAAHTPLFYTATFQIKPPGPGC